MKIRVKDLARFTPDKMAKIALATTERSQLDLYCVGSGQAQKAHTHEDQDKIFPRTRSPLMGAGSDPRTPQNRTRITRP